MNMTQCKLGDRLLLRNGEIATLDGRVCDGVCDVIYPYTIIYNDGLYSVTKDGLIFRDSVNLMDVVGFATKENKEINIKLIDKVLEQIKEDVINGDVTAIEELLKNVPIERLKSYLPEEGE